MSTESRNPKPETVNLRTTPSVASIRQLSPRVVNKIAAGEVIERPASVVKELMENAVDSGATRVDVTVEQGGTESITVADNGCGMPAAELKLAVTCHATSKICDADDLFRVDTLGFRGEALASIAEISQLSLRSRTADHDAGGELIVDGGQVSGPVPCGCPPGTVVSVQNLFFNTPVRRKFLRTHQTEMGHCSEAFTRIALAYPDVHFTLRNNSRELHELPPATNWRDRIASLFGVEIAEVLIDVARVDESIQLVGFVAAPSQSRSNNRMQYLLVNGRYIRDRSLQHALGEAYRGLLMVGRYPIAFLRINMPADQVDVNVHPTKLEVRFQDGGRVYSQLLGSLRNRFLKSDLTHSLDESSPRVSIPTSTMNSDDTSAKRKQIGGWAGQLGAAATSLANSKNTAPSGDVPDVGQSCFQSPQTAQALFSGRSVPANASAERRPEAESPCDLPAFPLPSDAQPVSDFQSAVPHTRSAIQVHNCYIVTETDNGVVMIDQHALHERIIYEQLRDKILAGKVETQKLLVPEPVDLRPAEKAAVIEAHQLLAEMGIDVQDFGGGTVLVVGYPAILANMNPTELLRQVVDLLLSENQGKAAEPGRNPDRRDMLDRLLHIISCKAAVKAGDHLSVEEIAALIDQRDLVQDSHHCPHGRPTALVLTKQELDRKFGRV